MDENDRSERPHDAERVRKAAEMVCFHWLDCERGACGHLDEAVQRLADAIGYAR